jgi:hypothetical protein
MLCAELATTSATANAGVSLLQKVGVVPGTLIPPMRKGRAWMGHPADCIPLHANDVVSWGSPLDYAVV